MLLSLPQGNSGPKLPKSPDLELLLRTSQQEDEDNEEEYFAVQGQQ